MPGLGLPELVLLPFLFVSFALPIASFALVFLTYRKVTAIERQLARSEPPQPE
jgi:hypothetical protein